MKENKGEIGMLDRLVNFRKEEPQLVTLTEPLRMMGVSTRTSVKTIVRDAGNLGQRYRKVKQAGLIQNKREPWAFVAISKGFCEDGGWDYLMGDIVTDFDNVPSGLTCFEIPAKKYAKFGLHPSAVVFWGISLGMLKRYIYTEWLPNSGYIADNSILGDFEYHDQRSLSKKPEIDLYVSIREKES
jgi:predicted transcriptional regulator YdeE